MQLTPEALLLDTMPCVGFILSMVMALEIGDVKRFPSAEQLASYAGSVPTVRSSGGRTRLGGISKEMNNTEMGLYRGGKPDRDVAAAAGRHACGEAVSANQPDPKALHSGSGRSSSSGGSQLLDFEQTGRVSGTEGSGKGFVNARVSAAKRLAQRG